MCVLPVTDKTLFSWKEGKEGRWEEGKEKTEGERREEIPSLSKGNSAIFKAEMHLNMCDIRWKKERQEKKELRKATLLLFFPPKRELNKEM